MTGSGTVIAGISGSGAGIEGSGTGIAGSGKGVAGIGIGITGTGTGVAGLGTGITGTGSWITGSKGDESVFSKSFVGDKSRRINEGILLLVLFVECRRLMDIRGYGRCWEFLG